MVINKLKQNISIEKQALFELIFVVAIFVLVFFRTGALMAPDSSEYVTGSTYRAGLYPRFIQTMCWIFGDNGLNVAALIQNVLSGISVWMVARHLSGLVFNNKSILLKICCFFCAFLPYLFISVGAKYWYPSAILSEGLSYPFYFFSICFFIKYLHNKDKVNYVMMNVLITIAAMNRSHLLIFEAILFVIIFLSDGISKKTLLRTIICISFSVMIVLGDAHLYRLNHGYTQKEINAIDATMTSDYVYLGVKEDSENMNEDQARLYNMVYELDEEIDYLYSVQKKEYSIVVLENARESKYNDAWEHVLYSGELENYRTWLEQKYGLSPAESLKKIKSIILQLDITIVKHHLFEYMGLYFLTFIKALLRAILPFPGAVKYNTYFVICYIITGLVLYGWSIHSTITNKDIKTKTLGAYALLSSIIHILPICILHSIEPRYFSYNVGIFYIMIVWDIFSKLYSKGNHVER